MRMSHVVICGLPRSATFFHIISSTAQFSGKKIIGNEMFFRFSRQLLSETFFVLRITEGDVVKNAYWYSRETPRYSCSILMELEFSGQISEKQSNIIFRENPSSGSQVLPSCGQMERQTDKHEEGYSRFPQFCEKRLKYI